MEHIKPILKRVLNNYLDVTDTGWNPNDEYQIKGLVMLGPNSIAWKKAPKEMQEKVMAKLKKFKPSPIEKELQQILGTK